jgi:hypothetical protein
MTRTRPPCQPKKLVLAGLSIAVLVIICFLGNAYDHGLGVWPVPLMIFVGLPAFVGYWLPLGSYRPRGALVVITAMLLFATTSFLANIGSHSLWLTKFGETVHCQVDNVERHKSTRGSDTFSNDLTCGDRKLTYLPTKFRSAKPVGTEMDLVVDKTGFVGSLEPDQVTWKYNLLLLGVLMNAVFMLLVALLPARAPAPAESEAGTTTPAAPRTRGHARGGGSSSA